MLKLTEHESALPSHDVVEPLIADGHVPRRVRRGRQLRLAPHTRPGAGDRGMGGPTAAFGTEILDIALEDSPRLPNVEQAKLLIRSGAPEPVIATLTRIGTVEGFGSMLRYAPVPTCSRSSTRTSTARPSPTSTAASSRPTPATRPASNPSRPKPDVVRRARHRVREPGDRWTRPCSCSNAWACKAGAAPDSAPATLAMANLSLPDDIDFELESLIERMVRLLMIEISAFHTFRWAEAVLVRHRLVAGDGEAARLVSYIRADETPHVEYIRTVLVRDARPHVRRRRPAGTIWAPICWPPSGTVSWPSGRTLADRGRAPRLARDAPRSGRAAPTRPTCSPSIEIVSPTTGPEEDAA